MQRIYWRTRCRAERRSEQAEGDKRVVVVRKLPGNVGELLREMRGRCVCGKWMSGSHPGEHGHVDTLGDILE